MSSSTNGYQCKKTSSWDILLNEELPGFYCNVATIFFCHLDISRTTIFQKDVGALFKTLFCKKLGMHNYV